VVLSPTDVIEPDLLALSPDEAGPSPRAEGHLPYLDWPYHDSMEAHSRYIINRAIEQAQGNQTKAAEFLRLQRTYLARLLKRQRERQDVRSVGRSD
jgi:DNA-binding NtrC family response regulator